MKRSLVILLIILGIPVGLVALIFTNLFFAPSPGPAKDITYGFTWSKPYAEALRINSQEGLEATLSDIGLRHIRLPVYWSEAEREEGTYNWQTVQEQLALVKKYDGTATLIIGAKQVRWPECWPPTWLNGRSNKERQQKALAYLEGAYKTFADDPTIIRWQIENEPAFPFGDCLEMDKEFVAKELALVRSWEEERVKAGKTKRPVVTTDAGEWSTWLDFAGKTDGTGISLYRTVLTPAPNHTKFHYWFLGPGYYALRAKWLKPLTGPIYISELQMEPWAPKAMTHDSPDEHFAIFTPKDMANHFRFANATGFKEIDFWGAEWWYFMKTQKNRPEYWDTMKGLLGK